MSRHINFIFILFLFSVLPLHGQIVIDMEQDGGVYKVPCSVNGVKMKFIFDTGASAVSLSKSMASFMEDNGYLKKSDYLGKTQTQIADGSFVDVEVISLKDFEIGGLHLKDVVATVKDGQNVPLLMGQSAIEKLGRISIEKGRLIIHQTSTTLSKEQIQSIRTKIKEHYSNNEFELVVKKSAELMRATRLIDSDYYYYVLGLFGCREYNQLIDIGKDWEVSGIATADNYTERILNNMATSYSAIGQLRDAIVYYQKSLPYADTYLKGSTLGLIASCYYELNDKNQTEYYLKQALSAQYTYLNSLTDNECSIADVIAGNVDDSDLGFLYYEYALFEETFNEDYSQRDYYLRLSAKCGYQRAIDFCFDNKINYTK